jgi:hypothetical protein
MLLWVAPWTSWLGPFPWVRMGLSILIFCVPGMIISLLLLGKKLTLLAHLTSGVAISVFLVGFLGMLGRTFNLPYAFIKPVFAVMGLAALFGLISRLRTDPELYKPKHFSLLASALLLFLFAFGILINLQSIFGGDDSSYLAYLTNWQHARPLNFEEVVFGSGDTDSIRFWLGMFPMSLAFLAELSKLHGLLLLGLYLEPYLVVIAILAIYNLYEVFLGEERLTIAALLLHFTFFVLLQGARQPGNVFFIRLSEDKVFAAFILAPALFLGVRHFLEASTLRAGIFVFLNGLSLALTHPIILAFSLFIACLYVILVTMVEKNQRTFGFAITLLIIPVIPSVLFRFIDGPQTQRYPVNLQSALDAYGSASETRFSYIAGTPFYGFDLGRIKIQTSEAEQENPLEIFLSWSYLWVLGTGFLWSLFHWRRKRATAPFMAATSGLVLLCGLPFTGWLLGYFVTAGMLWRSPWLLPIGFIGVIVLTELLNFILQGIVDRVEIKKFSEQVAFTSITVICSILLVNFSIHGYHSRQPLMIRPEGYAARLENLATLGNYLQNHLQQPAIFVAPLELMDYLPGLSSKAKVVFFRTSRYTPHPVDTKQLSLIFSRDPSILIQERMSILRMYDVQFIVIEDPVLREYYAHYTEFSNAQKVKNFWVIEFRDLSLSSHLPKVSSVMDHDKGRLLCEIEELKLRKN